MTSPEVYIHFNPEVFTDDGEVTNDSTKEFLRNYRAEYHDHVVPVEYHDHVVPVEYHDHVVPVLTVLTRQ